jgi:hypothetical protein
MRTWLAITARTGDLVADGEGLADPTGRAGRGAMITFDPQPVTAGPDWNDPSGSVSGRSVWADGRRPGTDQCEQL